MQWALQVCEEALITAPGVEPHYKGECRSTLCRNKVMQPYEVCTVCNQREKSNGAHKGGRLAANFQALREANNQTALLQLVRILAAHTALEVCRAQLALWWEGCFPSVEHEAAVRFV